MNGFGDDRGFDFMFQVFPIFFFIIFILMIGSIIYSIVKTAKQNFKNNQAPVLTVAAKVVIKRTDVSHYHHNSMNDNMDHVSSSTTYYATFEVESGDRIEFQVSGNEYGMLAEGDMGKLTFQGTRYLRFERL